MQFSPDEKTIPFAEMKCILRFEDGQVNGWCGWLGIPAQLWNTPVMLNWAQLALFMERKSQA